MDNQLIRDYIEKEKPRFLVNSRMEVFTIVSILAEIGFRRTNWTTEILSGGWDTLKYVHVTGFEIHGDFKAPANGIPFNKIEDFLSNIKKVTFDVKLNNIHTATISDDGIKVGCQIFPLSIIDDLVAARKSLNKANKNL